MSGADWIEAFLEMMAAERAAAANTLTAYAQDLADVRLPRWPASGPGHRGGGGPGGLLP